MNYDTLIVDGPYLAHRSYSAPYHLTTKAGLDSTMIHSFMRSLNAIRKKFPTKEIIVAWESHGTPSWRRGMLPTYKPGKTLEGAFVQEIKDLQILLHLLLHVKIYISLYIQQELLLLMTLIIQNLHS